jgi:hypothetical protein
VRVTIFSLLTIATASVFAIAAAPKKPPPPPPVPVVPPQVSLTLTADAADSGWSMKIENTGSVPLRIVADARLLSFEITGADSGPPIKCALPQDARPTTDLQRALVVPPGRSYTERFDPRLYCFAPKEEAGLVEGATIVAKYGWAPPKTGPLTTPFVVSPPDVDPLSNADAGFPSPAKEIVSASMTLPKHSAGPGWFAPPDGPRLRVRMTQRTDTGSLFDQTVTVTVHNDGIRSETMMLVPATVAFDLQGPRGRSIRCSLGVAPTGIRDLATTIGPGKEASVSVALDRLCPTNTFDWEGLYRVVPWFDTRRVLAPPGMPMTNGTWMGDPAIVRVRQGKLVAPAPQLDPDPNAKKEEKITQPGKDSGR